MQKSGGNPACFSVEKLQENANKWKAPSGKEYLAVKKRFKRMQREALAPPYGHEYIAAKERFETEAKKQKQPN